MVLTSEVSNLETSFLIKARVAGYFGLLKRCMLCSVDRYR